MNGTGFPTVQRKKVIKMEATLINPFNAGLNPSAEVNPPTKAQREKEQQSLLNSEKRKNEAKGFFQMRGLPFPYFWEYEMNEIKRKERGG